MTIREAKNTDINQIVDLYHELFVEMSVLQPQSFAPGQQNRMYVRNMIQSRDTALFVSCDDGGYIRGFALVEESETPDYNALIKRRYAYLMDIVVAREHRNAGIGSQLIGHVRDWAIDRGLEYLELNVLSQNKLAITLYERMGFAGAKQVMQCPLPNSKKQSKY
ncbi:GNAT family N-acetyltransferase [Bacteroides sp. OttesenSCG-928-J23]|nr:GNAT family N-acetyltransferase [Bacteroides sp. OttesenSCG-928-J23]